MKKKIVLVVVILLLLLLSGIIYIYIKNENMVAILGYHSILPKEDNTSGDNLVVDREKFEKEIELLEKMNYETMSLDEFYCWKNKTCKKKHKSVLITFDDGYINNYEYAFDILKDHNMKAVVFVIGNYVEADNNIHMNLETLEKIKEEYPNIEIASHSYNLHFHSDKTYDIVDEDIKKMKQIVDSNYFAYPFGDYNDEYIRALSDNEYKMAFTFGPSKEHRKVSTRDDNYKVPRLNISNDMPLWKFILRLILPM